MAPDILLEWIEHLILTGVQTRMLKQNVVTEDVRGFSLSLQANAGIIFRRYKV
jgi:hypothetical protein